MTDTTSVNQNLTEELTATRRDLISTILQLTWHEERVLAPTVFEGTLDELLADTLVIACEGGINYWTRDALHWRTPEPVTDPQDIAARVSYDRFPVAWLSALDPEGPGLTVDLDREFLLRGLDTYLTTDPEATGAHPDAALTEAVLARRFGAAGSRIDARIADEIVQCALYAHIVWS